MNGDTEQNKEHPKSQPQPENKLQSIRDINKSIKEGDEKYADRLGVLADLLSDLNATGEQLIHLLIEIRDRLPEKATSTGFSNDF